MGSEPSSGSVDHAVISEAGFALEAEKAGTWN